MTYLLDTCIISRLRKIARQPDPPLEQWISQHSETQYFLSVLTIGEIQRGIFQSRDTKQRGILEDWLWGFIVPRFGDRILTLDIKTMSYWGELTGSCSKRGVNLPSIDSLIAASAIRHNLILISHNCKDFEKIEGLKFLNPTLA